MLKFLILSTVLLNFVACRYVDKNDEKFCEAEHERFRFCTKIMVNAIENLPEAQEQLNNSSSTVSPYRSPVAREIKKAMECIGDLECKGKLKLTKFQLDTTGFYRDQVIEAQECFQDEEIDFTFAKCVSSLKGFPFPKGFSSTVVPCVKKVLEGFFEDHQVPVIRGKIGVVEDLGTRKSWSSQI